MTTEKLMLENIYHCLQHIKSDLEDITTDRIKSIEYTVNHMLKNLDNYYDKEKPND